MLEDARQNMHVNGESQFLESGDHDHGRFVFFHDEGEHRSVTEAERQAERSTANVRRTRKSPHSAGVKPHEVKQGFQGRKPITEVLQDIYDEKTP